MTPDFFTCKRCRRPGATQVTTPGQRACRSFRKDQCATFVADGIVEAVDVSTKGQFGGCAGLEDRSPDQLVLIGV
jgi:hypothetical protein